MCSLLVARTVTVMSRFMISKVLTFLVNISLLFFIEERLEIKNILIIVIAATLVTTINTAPAALSAQCDLCWYKNQTDTAPFPLLLDL
jgi:hypothetical protein